MWHVIFFKKIDFVESSKGVDQHTKVITQKGFVSIERMAAAHISGNMMPVAGLQ